MTPHSIRGNTLRWTFDDGPTKGTSFTHTFGRDGSVTYKMAGSPKETREDHYDLIEVNDDVCAVSYLAKSGWTLTVMLDFKSHAAIGVASNDKQLVVQHGHFESLPPAGT